MATATVTTVPTINGFHVPLTRDDMKLANVLCNKLPRMNSDMDPDQEHIKNLSAIIAQHQMAGKFATVLLHKHENTPAGQVKLEVELKTMPDKLIKPILAEIVDSSKLDATLKAMTGKWMRPIQLDSLDLRNVHGIVFKLNTDENCLAPFEFAEGPVPLSKDDNTLANFINVFVNYVKRHNLADVFGLQYLGLIDGDGQYISRTAEFELGKEGTIVLPTSVLKDVELVSTSWHGASEPTEGEPPAGESWAKRVVGGVETHKVFYS
ncbi:unnamed protein product [Clonostachys chloroleuca]|uniref:Uncharacterized protein n=1 Tax=Clonostachys chloroleuca TaxID=1926264 RepID=A0AA35LSC9_9HYPO|nr:unnamed protein product [Clonostachys chloroleuca]